MVKLRIYNRCLDEDSYKYYKEQVKKIFLEFYPEIEEKVNLSIFFVSDEKIKNSTGYGAVMASTNGWNNSYTIEICQRTIERANKNIISLYYTLYHELVHLYDLYHISTNKYNKVLEMNSLTNKKNFIIHLGIDFWNEFNAYSQGFVFFKNINYPGFYDILKSFNYLKKKTNSLKEKDVSLFVREIDAFLYRSAYYMAGKIYGKRKKSSLSKNTIEKLDAKGLVKRYNNLVPYLNKIAKNPYGKQMEKNLYKLGKRIMKDFYNYFFVYVYNKNGMLNFKVRIVKT